MKSTAIALAHHRVAYLGTIPYLKLTLWSVVATYLQVLFLRRGIFIRLALPALPPGIWLLKKCVSAWKEYGSDLRGTVTPVCPTQQAPPLPLQLRVGRARFWELGSVTVFDQLLFSRNTSDLETFFYLLRMRLFGRASMFVIRNDAKKVVATVYLRFLRNQPKTGYISNVGVHPDYRRLGLARYLMQWLAQPEARRLGFTRLVLNAKDAHIQAFYKSLGYQYFLGERFDIETPADEVPMFLEW